MSNCFRCIWAAKSLQLFYFSKCSENYNKHFFVFRFYKYQSCLTKLLWEWKKFIQVSFLCLIIWNLERSIEKLIHMAHELSHKSRFCFILFCLHSNDHFFLRYLVQLTKVAVYTSKCYFNTFSTGHLHADETIQCFK